MSWGTLPSGVLAVTCKTTDEPITEADIQINAAAGIVDTLPGSCTSQSDLQSVTTHEWGHVYGLAHETSNADEVMWPTVGPCRLRRHLGKGDYNGMAQLYHTS